MKQKDNTIKHAIVYVTLLTFVVIALALASHLEKERDAIKFEYELKLEVADSVINMLYDSLDVYSKKLERSEEIVIFLNDEVAKLHGRNILSYINTDVYE